MMFWWACLLLVAKASYEMQTMMDRVFVYVLRIGIMSGRMTSRITGQTTAEPLGPSTSWMNTAENVWQSG